MTYLVTVPCCGGMKKTARWRSWCVHPLFEDVLPVRWSAMNSSGKCLRTASFSRGMTQCSKEQSFSRLLSSDGRSSSLMQCKTGFARMIHRSISRLNRSMRLNASVLKSLALHELLGDLRDRPCGIAQGRPHERAEDLGARYFSFAGPSLMNFWRSLYEDLPHKYRSFSRRLFA
jgi:hypothetical protein